MQKRGYITAGAVILCLLGLMTFIPTASAGQGGPGTGDYVWINNPNVSFLWEDISGSGTNMNMGDDQNKAIAFPSGFKTKFYGTEYSSIRVSSNGFLSYTSTATAATPVAIPNGGNPNDILAVFWMDHYPNCPHPDTGGVYYQFKGTSPNRYLVVSWEDMPRYYNNACLGFSNFQAKIFEGTDYVEFHYKNANSYARDAVAVNICYDLSIGVEGQVSGATKGLRYVWRDGCVGAYNLVNRPIAWWQDSPIDIANQQFVTDVNVPLTQELVVSDDPWTMSVTQMPSSGALDTSAFPTIKYTPNSGFVGNDNFKIRLDDKHGSPETATITIKVNGPPNAVADSYEVMQDASLTVEEFGFMANDEDPNSDAMTHTVTAAPTRGSLTTDAYGNFTYTPNSGYTGQDQFQYRLNDGRLDGNVAVVTIDVTSLPIDNRAPVVTPQSLEVMEDGSIEWSPIASDEDGDPLTFTVTAPSMGAMSDDGAGTYTYSPDANQHGSDSVSVTANDGELSASATVTFTILPVNDAPVAGDDAVTAAQDQVLQVQLSTLLANDMDIDGDALTITDAAYSSQGGSVTLADGVLSYAAPAGFTGTDTLLYTLSDGTTTSQGLLVITVNPANEVPPVPAFSWTTDAPVLTTGYPIVLVDESTQGGSAIVSSIFTRNGQAMTQFTPTQKGPHDVTLQLVDENGLTATLTKTIDVLNAKPSATLVLPSGAVTPGLAIALRVDVTDDGTFDVAWSIEGKTLYGSSIQYKFQNIGQQSVTATITDQHGVMITVTDSITVEEHKGATRNGGGGTAMGGLRAPPAPPVSEAAPEPAPGPAVGEEVFVTDATSKQVETLPVQTQPTSAQAADVPVMMWSIFGSIALLLLAAAGYWGYRNVRVN